MKKISNLPYFSNTNLTYIDEYSEWWMATDELGLMPDEIIMNTDNIFLAHWKEINNEWNYIKQNISLNIKSSDITSFIRYGSNIYVGTNKGLLLYNINKKKWSYYDEINDEYYIYNLERSDGYIYVATNRGLKIISIINDTVLNYNNIELFNDYTGERLAINEFNLNSETIKISKSYHFISQPKEVWHHQIWICHFFKHKKYNTFVSETGQRL